MSLRLRPFLWAAIVLITIFVCSSGAYAHRVSVFAYVEGPKIFTESYFSKKKKVHQGKIEIFKSQNGKLLLSGVTDDNGNFNFPIPDEIKSDKSGLLIVLHASEGHRGEWTLTEDEIFPNSSSQENVVTETQDKLPAVIESTKLSNTELDSLHNEIKELNAKIDTLKRLILNQQENGPGANEIFSGIGYILGLFGVAAFFVSRKK